MAKNSPISQIVLEMINKFPQYSHQRYVALYVEEKLIMVKEFSLRFYWMEKSIDQTVQLFSESALKTKKMCKEGRGDQIKQVRMSFQIIFPFHFKFVISVLIINDHFTKLCVIIFIIGLFNYGMRTTRWVGLWLTELLRLRQLEMSTCQQIEADTDLE